MKTEPSIPAGIIELAMDSTLLNAVNDLTKIHVSVQESLLLNRQNEQEVLRLMGLINQIAELTKSIEKSMNYRESKSDVHGTPVHQLLLHKIREFKLILLCQG